MSYPDPNFEIENIVWFDKDENDMIYLNVNSAKARARISLHGGQVLSYRPQQEKQDLLFVSEKAWFDQHHSIKGGCPVCWPCFAQSTDNEKMPFHGFVRDKPWQVQSTRELENGDIQIALEFKDTAASREIWPYSFTLTETITIGEQLIIALESYNESNQPMTLTQAIHTYFSIGDISAISISGLEQIYYLDKVDHFAEKQQHGAITVSQEVDRIYQQTGSDITIIDEKLDRTIHIQSQGSATTVVWNPWVDISRNSKDLADDDYLRFVCVETANAADEIITIAAGQRYLIKAIYSITH